MRLRNSVAAAVGALVLVLALPTSAQAADGRFTYISHDGGWSQGRYLSDPPSGVCITLPGAEDPVGRPADSPRNDTDAWARVFTGTGCDGDYFDLRPSGGRASDRLKLRSVVFSWPDLD
ncbi:hypothetical protein [Streptacidiphilus albus]|uniref:hypothetical protein n=1 Tax=Streptacidiphilus albus TaxID=105425 RepID=UPI00054C7093|nr:hypothetical protein [Streptacidiphilus albus]